MKYALLIYGQEGAWDALSEEEREKRWKMFLSFYPLAKKHNRLTIGSDAAFAVAMAVLLLAFALDGFCALTVQIYFRINRARIAAVTLMSEFATMVVVTLAFQSTGALAPSLGQLGARLLAVVIIAGPIVLAGLGRLGWFEVAETDAVGGEGVGIDVRAAEERLGL